MLTEMQTVIHVVVCLCDWPMALQVLPDHFLKEFTRPEASSPFHLWKNTSIITTARWLLLARERNMPPINIQIQIVLISYLWMMSALTTMMISTAGQKHASESFLNWGINYKSIHDIIIVSASPFNSITQCLITLTCDLLTSFELGSGYNIKTNLVKHLTEHKSSDWGHLIKREGEI